MAAVTTGTSAQKRMVRHTPEWRYPKSRWQLSLKLLRRAAVVTGLFWMVRARNIGYHIEHHWYPSVPFYNLPQLHARLAAQPEFVVAHAEVTRSVFASLSQCTSAGGAASIAEIERAVQSARAGPPFRDVSVIAMQQAFRRCKVRRSSYSSLVRVPHL